MKPSALFNKSLTTLNRNHTITEIEETDNQFHLDMFLVIEYKDVRIKAY